MTDSWHFTTRVITVIDVEKPWKPIEKNLGKLSKNGGFATSM